jgi:hypothetical protein
MIRDINLTTANEKAPNPKELGASHKWLARRDYFKNFLCDMPKELFELNQVLAA